MRPSFFKRASLVLFAAFFLLGAADKKPAVPPRDVTGLEWLQSSVGARTDQVIGAMLRLTQSGVPLAYPPDRYYNAVHEAVRRDPSLYRVPVTEIVARHVYQDESESRPAIDALRARRSAAKAG